MPAYYRVNTAETTNSSAGTQSLHAYAQTVAEQESANIKGVYAAARFGTAGGAQLRVQQNTGTTASGGTSVTASKDNMRINPTAQTLWRNDASAITAGATLATVLTVGFAQTGGMGGWVALENPAGIQMMANFTNPVDLEFGSLANAGSVLFDMTVEFSEGY